LEPEYSGQDEYPEKIDARLGQREMALEALETSVRYVDMPAQAPNLTDGVVAKLVDERHAAWEADLPESAASMMAAR
jgi:hypothetical protein